MIEPKSLSDMNQQEIAELCDSIKTAFKKQSRTTQVGTIWNIDEVAEDVRKAELKELSKKIESRLKWR